MAKKQKPSGETASELSHRHLSDENHHTTEEEIRNVSLDLDLPTGADSTGSDRNNKNDDEEDKIITTPLTILGE